MHRHDVAIAHGAQGRIAEVQPTLHDGIPAADGAGERSRMTQRHQFVGTRPTETKQQDTAMAPSMR